MGTLDDLLADPPNHRPGRWEPTLEQADKIRHLRDLDVALEPIAEALKEEGNPVSVKTLGAWLRHDSRQAD